jgi:hypothetical protein
MTAKAVLHIEPLHSLADIGNRGDHILRHYQAPNIAPDRTHHNRVLIDCGPDLATVAAARIGDQRLRSDARRAASVLLSASPEYFRPSAPAVAGTWDDDRLQAWQDASMQWLIGRYGDNVISASLHLDEVTSHIHAVVLPIRDNGSLSYKAFFGDKQILRDIQTDYARPLATLGIERGQAHSLARHEDVQAYYQRP